MHIVLGGTGHVGSAVVDTLLARGEAVTLVTRNAAHAAPWAARGAQVAQADILDVDALREVLRQGRRAFLLNPPADPSGDTDAVERRTVDAILAAVEGAGLEKVVAESTGGAQPGQDNGDLGPLHALEEGLRALSVPATLLRAGYYMSNWDAQIETARETGRIQTFYPADFPLPMVAPRDLGRAAADFLLQPPARTATCYVEGPRRYSSADVAEALGSVLGRPVALEVVPRERWQEAYVAMGFSAKAAASYARMTAITLQGDYEQPADPVRGATTLHDYFAGIAAA